MAEPQILESFILDLGDGLVMRRATPEDADALADFNALVHRNGGEGDPDVRIGAWTREMMNGTHPTVRASDFLLVEDTRTHTIVSSTNLISQTWTYDGIPFRVGRPELVGTHPDYRKRGLVAVQMRTVHEWSRERGEIVTAITGIPWFYRQFGYEMCVTLDGGRSVSASQVMPLREGEVEPYRLRLAQGSDLPFLARLYDDSARADRLACVRDEKSWLYELNGRLPDSIQRLELVVIETLKGEAIGWLLRLPFLQNSSVCVLRYELMSGVSWLQVTPSVLRALQHDLELPTLSTFGALGTIRFDLGDTHPAFDTCAHMLPTRHRPYPWYLRVPDLVAFLRQIAPALERRLARSSCAGHTDALTISLFREGVRFELTRGALTTIEPWQPPHPNVGDVTFPEYTFYQALFGYRTLSELHEFFGDCLVQRAEAGVLFEALFPKQDSHIWTIS